MHTPQGKYTVYIFFLEMYALVQCFCSASDSPSVFKAT